MTSPHEMNSQTVEVRGGWQPKDPVAVDNLLNDKRLQAGAEFALWQSGVYENLPPDERVSIGRSIVNHLMDDSSHRSKLVA